MRVTSVLFASLLAMAAYTVNAGSTANLPDDWSIGGEAAKLYRADVDTSDSPSGKGSVVLRRSETSHPFGGAHMVRTFPAAAYAGKRVRVSMHARYEGERPRMEGMLVIGTDEGYHTSGLDVDSGWHLYQTIVTWPADIKKVTVGVALNGSGSAKVDGIELEVLGDAPAGQRHIDQTALLIDGQSRGKDSP